MSKWRRLAVKCSVFFILLTIVGLSVFASSMVQSSQTVSAYGTIGQVSASGTNGQGGGSSGSMALHQSGYKLLNANGTEVLLRGVGDFWTNYQSDHIMNLYGTFDTAKADAAFQFIHDQGGNLYRIFLPAEWILSNPSNYINNLNSLITLAANHGIYVLCVFRELAQGTGGSDIELPYDPYIVDSGWTTAKYNQACAALATICEAHPNALIETWNEPTNMDQSAYYNVYWNNVPATITAIRNAGFTGIIVVMGEMSFAPGYANSGMGWAINHPNIFGPGMNVMAEFHCYWEYMSSTDQAMSESQLQDLWFTTGRITEARNDGIPVLYGEFGTLHGLSDVAAQDQGLAMMLDIAVNNRLPFSAFSFSSPYGAEEMLNNENTPFTSSSWDNSGLILAAAWQRIAALT